MVISVEQHSPKAVGIRGGYAWAVSKKMFCRERRKGRYSRQLKRPVQGGVRCTGKERTRRVGGQRVSGQ